MRPYGADDVGSRVRSPAGGARPSPPAVVPRARRHAGSQRTSVRVRSVRGGLRLGPQRVRPCLAPRCAPPWRPRSSVRLPSGCAGGGERPVRRPFPRRARRAPAGAPPGATERRAGRGPGRTARRRLRPAESTGSYSSGVSLSESRRVRARQATRAVTVSAAFSCAVRPAQPPRSGRTRAAYSWHIARTGQEAQTSMATSSRAARASAGTNVVRGAGPSCYSGANTHSAPERRSLTRSVRGSLLGWTLIPVTSVRGVRWGRGPDAAGEGGCAPGPQGESYRPTFSEDANWLIPETTRLNRWA